jgi:5-methylcytosine-specific restriction protein B
MGTFTSRGEQSRQTIDEAVADWKQSCLLADGSLLFSEAQVWTLEAVEEMYRRYNENPLLGGDSSFEEKLERQLAGADTSVIRFAAEAMLVYWLFPHRQVHPDTKREQIAKILSWGTDGDDVAEKLGDRLAWKALEPGIGNPGGGYLFNRWRELGFIIDWVRDWKRLDDSDRERLLNDHAGFRTWLDQRESAEGRQFRHILLNLLWPDSYERIASGRHKREIVKTFGALIDSEIEDDDDKLAAIRSRLRELVPNSESDGDPDWMPTGDDGQVPDDEFDFYRPPVVRAWLAGKEDSLPALLFKKAVVLYGPPGTGKTYEANQLAVAVIRRSALDKWGATKYFEQLGEVEAAARDNIHRLQLHPAYSYEDFIGGLRMTAGGGVAYRPGRLSRLCDEVRSDEGGLPHVLILDEMNRADLSRLFGEAFSAFELEKRDQPIDLSVEDPETGKPRQLEIPGNLFVIGTMNMIDQSVEQIDFAMRRRFLWQESRFDQGVLMTVLEERWRAEERKQPWEKVKPDMQLLAEAASRLNARIATIDELGEQYEIGHTYMFDIVKLLDDAMTSRSSTYLWTRSREPKDAVHQLWDLALMPLLHEYLAGLEAERSKELLGELWTAFSRP